MTENFQEYKGLQELNIFYQNTLDKNLVKAVKNNKLSLIKKLLDNGARINTKTYEQILLNITGTDKSLPKNEANINYENKLVETLVNIAKKEGNKAILYLLECKNNLNELLVLSSKAGDLVSVHKYCEAGADINHKSQLIGKTALYFSIIHDFENITEHLLKTGSGIDKYHDRNYLDISTQHKCVIERYYNPPLLNTAVERNSIKAVNLLIKHGANINLCDDRGRTPLHLLSAGYCNTETAKLLIHNGANIYARDYMQGKTPLAWAAQYGAVEILEMLIQNKANINAQDKNGMTALHWATKCKNTKIVALLIQNGANINAQDKNGMTALHWAAQCGHVKIANLLTQSGASVNLKNIHGKTSLDIAWEKSNYNMVLLLEKMKKILDHNLATVAKYNQPDLLQDYDAKLVIISARTNAENVDNIISTPLHLAALTGNTKQAKALINNKANVNDQKSGWSPLHIAVLSGNIDVARLLIENKASINAKNNLGFTALHIATESGNADMVKLFLKNGADIHLLNNKNNTALHFATQSGDAGIVKCLCNCGADTNAQGEYLFTPLHIAARTNKARVANVLLRYGANVDDRDQNDNTPLHEAVIIESKSVIKLLLDNKADINAQNIGGYTPLHFAAKIGLEDIITTLLERGANIHAEDIEGNTPLDIAKKTDKQQIINLLEKAQKEHVSKMSNVTISTAFQQQISRLH